MGFDAKFVQDGKAIDYIAPADVAAGAIVVQGGIVGVAKLDIGSGCRGALATEGVYECAVGSGVTFSAGATVYWNTTSKYATNVSSGNTEIGYATEAVVSGGATVKVLLKR